MTNKLIDLLDGFDENKQYLLRSTQIGYYVTNITVNNSGDYICGIYLPKKKIFRKGNTYLDYTYPLIGTLELDKLDPGLNLHELVMEAKKLGYPVFYRPQEALYNLSGCLKKGKKYPSLKTSQKILETIVDVKKSLKFKPKMFPN